MDRVRWRTPARTAAHSWCLLLVTHRMSLLKSIFMKTAKQFPYLAAYLRFLNLAATVMAMPGLDAFGVDERALFEEILRAWGREQPLSVRQAIDLKALGSPATLHKRLVRLRKMDMVYAEIDERDRRTKLLVPTDKGLRYANTLGKAISARP